MDLTNDINCLFSKAFLKFSNVVFIESSLSSLISKLFISKAYFFKYIVFFVNIFKNNSHTYCAFPTVFNVLGMSPPGLFSVNSIKILCIL